MVFIAFYRFEHVQLIYSFHGRHFQRLELQTILLRKCYWKRVMVSSAIGLLIFFLICLSYIYLLSVSVVSQFEVNANDNVAILSNIQLLKLKISKKLYVLKHFKGKIYPNFSWCALRRKLSICNLFHCSKNVVLASGTDYYSWPEKGYFASYGIYIWCFCLNNEINVFFKMKYLLCFPTCILDLLQVVSWRYNVWDACRLSSVLLWWSCNNMQKGFNLFFRIRPDLSTSYVGLIFL
jgi:hypothetical protein